jgi:acyl carrier protein
MDPSLESEVLVFVLRTFRELTVDVDVDAITADTVLKTLGLRSIVLINAIAEIQERFGLENRLLERILGGNVALDEHSVGGLVGLVVASSNARD